MATSRVMTYSAINKMIPRMAAIRFAVILFSFFSPFAEELALLLELVVVILEFSFVFLSKYDELSYA